MLFRSGVQLKWGQVCVCVCSDRIVLSNPSNVGSGYIQNVAYIIDTLYNDPYFSIYVGNLSELHHQPYIYVHIPPMRTSLGGGGFGEAAGSWEPPFPTHTHTHTHTHTPILNSSVCFLRSLALQMVKEREAERERGKDALRLPSSHAGHLRRA